jgi:hypothetical protein
MTDHPQDLINRAYQLAHRFGSKGELSRIELTERIAREGIPADLAQRAADDVILDAIAAKQKKGSDLMNYGLLVLALGIALTITSYLVIKIMIVIPIGFIFFGIVVSLAGYSRSKSKTL